MDDAAARERLAQRLRAALAMCEDGFVMKRQQLRRRNPEADEAEIERLFVAWINDRPMDGPGRRVSWPDRTPLPD